MAPLRAWILLWPSLLILGVIGLVHSPSIGAWSPTDPTPEATRA